MRRRLACVGAIAAAACAAAASPASALEAVTPQAADANAAFLAYAPPPATPMKVCVVDTGVDLTTDAAPAVIERWNVYGGDVGDGGGSGIAKHGTFVAGVIASQADGRDSVGIWPQAKIVSVRVFAGSGGGTTVADYVRALDKCRERGTTVVNLSLSGLDSATDDELVELRDRIGALRALRGVNVIAGVGNAGGPVGYPARLDDVLGVGATSTSGDLCSFSARGLGLDVNALGCDVELSWPSGGVARGSGTSFSAPVVTAVVAALRAYRSDLSPSDAERIVVAAGAHGMWANRIDAAATFRAAGLASMVVDPAAAEVVGPSPTINVHSLDLRRNALHELGVRRPKVRMSWYRAHRFFVRLSTLPDFAHAIFVVDGRRYVRRTGALSLQMSRRPHRVRVQTFVPGVGGTDWVTVSTGNRGSSTVSPEPLK